MTMNEPIRILHVVSFLGQGGIETLLMSLYRNIDRTKVQFDFLQHTSKEEYFDKEIESLGGRVYRIPRYSLGEFYKQSKEYDKFFRNHPEYAIVHSHINLNSLGVLRSAYKFGVPTRICHLHASNRKGKDITLPYRCKKLFFPLISKYLTHRFACSRVAAQDGYGKKHTDFVVINNAVQTEKFRFCLSDRNRKRAELGWNDKFVIIDVANFTFPKNHRFLIKVFNETLKKRQDVILALAGGFGSTIQAQVENQVKQLGISDYVQFLGQRNDVPDLFKAADLFVFPSLYEGFGIVVEEAQASGLPIVASDVLPEETKSSDLIRYVSLSESPEQWSQIVLEEADKKRNPRETYADVVKSAGFDVKTVAEELTNFYLGEYQKNLGRRSS